LSKTFGKFLILLVFDLLIIILTAAFIHFFVALLHPTIAAYGRAFMGHSPINQFAHTIVKMDSGTHGSAEIKNRRYGNNEFFHVRYVKLSKYPNLFKSPEISY
jgi:hypothetical protein